MTDQPIAIFRMIEFGSDDYRKERVLRRQVLRAPPGLDYYREDLAQEKNQLHFGLFNQHGDGIACVIAVPRPGSEVKIRLMAVRSDRQGNVTGEAIGTGSNVSWPGGVFPG